MRKGSGISSVDKHGLVMVLGKVEDNSENMNQERLFFVTLGEERFLLRSSSEVDGVGSLSDKRVTILGTIDRTTPEQPTLTVLGYRTLPPLPPRE